MDGQQQHTRWRAPWRWGADGQPHRRASGKVHTEQRQEQRVDPVQPLDPVLLIPGIGGSILHAVTADGKGKESVERVWVRLYNAEKEFQCKMWSKFDPESGESKSLDPNTHLVVPEDNFGLYSCDKLDPDVWDMMSLEAVNYYHVMILEMKKWGYVAGETLFGFGYDFRQSNRLPVVMDRLSVRLEAIHKKTGKKVDVVTHSMGGLLFKSLVALHPDVVERHVGKWVSIVAPFQGAPGFIMDTLLTGVEFLKGWQRNLFIGKWSMHQLLVECPSVYELMADYAYDWPQPPQLQIVRPATSAPCATPSCTAPTSSLSLSPIWPFTPGGGDGGKDPPAPTQIDVYCSLESVLGFLRQVLKDNKVDLNGKVTPLPLNEHIVTLAEGTKELWRRAVLPDSVQMFVIYGNSLDTPFHARYGSEDAPLQTPKDILHTEAVFSCVNGDGTVPVDSAKAHGLRAVATIGVPGEHRALLNDKRVHNILRFFLRVPPHDEFYDPYTDCVLLPSREEIEAEMRQVAAAEAAAAAEEAGAGEGGAIATGAAVVSASTVSSKGCEGMDDVTEGQSGTQHMKKGLKDSVVIEDGTAGEQTYVKKLEGTGLLDLTPTTDP